MPADPPPAAPPGDAPVTRGARLRRVLWRLAAPLVWCAAALGAALAAGGRDEDGRRPPTALHLTLGGADLGETAFAPHGVWHPRSVGIAAVSDGLRRCGSGNWDRPLFGLAAAWDGAAAGPGVCVARLGTGPAVLFLLCCAVPWWVFQSRRGWARDPDAGRLAAFARFGRPWAVTFAAVAALCVGTAGGVRVRDVGPFEEGLWVAPAAVRRTTGLSSPLIDLRWERQGVFPSLDDDAGDYAVRGRGFRASRSHDWGEPSGWSGSGLTPLGSAERRLAVSLWYVLLGPAAANLWGRARRRRCRRRAGRRTLAG